MGALAAPNTVNTVPEETLLAFANHGEVDRAMRRDGDDCEQVLAGFARAGIDVPALARQLQDEGASGFVDVLEGSALCHRDEEQGARLAVTLPQLCPHVCQDCPCADGVVRHATQLVPPLGCRSPRGRLPFDPRGATRAR